YTSRVVSNYHLRYIAISTNNPTVISTARDITTGYGPSQSLAFDALAIGTRLYIAYNELSGGQAVDVTYLANIATGPVTPHSYSGYDGSIFTIAADLTTPQNPTIYVSFVSPLTTTTKVLAVDQNLNTILAPYIVSSSLYVNLASAAQNGVLSLFLENENFYPDGTTPTNFISTLTLSDASTIPVVSAITVVERSVGLASKAFLFDGTAYMLVVYASTYQPSFFLINQYGNIIAKLAYSNAGSLNLSGGAYLAYGLPSVTLTGNLAQIAYLIKDSITALNKNNGAINDTAGIYAQSGINLAAFTIGTSSVSASEAAQTLNLSGGFVWSYDGYLAVEQNFFVWPDYVTAVWSATGGTLAAQPDGMTNTDAYYYQVIYSWADNQGNRNVSAPSIPVAVTTT